MIYSFIMKENYWFLLFLSALLYALPFLLSEYVWWMVFFFPVPLLYITRRENLSFFHGYVWAVGVFFLHLSGGICVIASLAGKAWWVGIFIGVVVVLYQAL